MIPPDFDSGFRQLFVIVMVLIALAFNVGYWLRGCP